ncbi:helix-turn-helix domain-containing protein [Modestobacter sp. SSW1-42]|uniref:helix-turn-helix domain-containing protein n=1 Tax=Modestobacter sp. SSW1-42 TaxID=596372 RepID=UPI0039858E87
MTPEYLTTNDLAVLTRSNASTVRSWRFRRVGPPGVRVGRRILYRRADVEAWFDGRLALDREAA